MPFIHIKTSHKLDEGQINLLKDKIFDTIDIIKGKTRDMLMVHLEDNQKMFYQGKNDATLIDVMVAGKADTEDFIKHCEVITKIFCDVSGARSKTVYIKYGQMPYCGIDGRLKM